MNEIKQIEIDNKLWFKITKLVFSFGTSLIGLGYLISWLLVRIGTFSNSVIILPIILCNLCSLGLWVLTFWLDYKDMLCLKAVVTITKKEWDFYKLSHYVYVGAFMLSLIIYMIISQTWGRAEGAFITIAACACVFSLITIGMYRYAVWKIELILAKRKYQSVNDSKSEFLKNKLLAASLTHEQYQHKKETEEEEKKITTPTSGFGSGN